MIQKIAQKVTTYEYWKILFTNVDIVLIKTKGKRQFTCPKTGKEKCHVVKVYLDYLQSCLKGCDGKFRFDSVILLKETISRLPESANERFIKQNLDVEIFFSLSKKDENSLFSLWQKRTTH